MCGCAGDCGILWLRLGSWAHDNSAVGAEDIRTLVADEDDAPHHGLSVVRDEHFAAQHLLVRQQFFKPHQRGHVHDQHRVPRFHHALAQQRGRGGATRPPGAARVNRGGAAARVDRETLLE